VFFKSQPIRLLAVIAFALTAATARADVIIERQGTSYIEQSNTFAALAEIVVGSADVHINGIGVFGQTSVPTNVKWVIFDSLTPASPTFLSGMQAIAGTPGSYATSARWYDSPLIDFTLQANHHYAMGLLSDKLGPTGFRWGITPTSTYAGGGPAVSAHGLTMPFGSVRANAGLSGSFYSAPSVYTFAGQSDPLQWSDSFQPSLRIMASVPEPRQWSMILSGLLVLGVVAHRRRRGPPRR